MTTISDVVTSFTDGGAGIGAVQDITLTAGPLPTNVAAPSTTTDSSNYQATQASSPSEATSAGIGGSSSSSKAASPMITQAPWLVGGAAVAAAYAAM